MGWRTAAGTCPARPPGSIPPDGQNRSPAYSSGVRMSSRVVPGSAIAARTASCPARRRGSGGPAVAAGAGSAPALLTGRPSSRQLSREQFSILASACPYSFASQKPMAGA